MSISDLYCGGERAVVVFITPDPSSSTTIPCPGCEGCLTFKEIHGRCEDAPCCGCCGNYADAEDTGMSKADYMERYADPDYDPDYDFSMNY